MDFFDGITLVGINAENGRKLLLTLVLFGAVFAISSAVRGLLHLLIRDAHSRSKFWTRQAISLTSAVFILLGLLSIWFDDPTRLATALGLVTAGLAFALQRVITAFAAYFVILRGDTFNVGDRISMGGVRGDVIALGFIKTTIMEMGQPPAVQNTDPAMWVRSRQYTGRVVTVTNDRIFDEPVFNFSHRFPFIWEEMTLPVSFTADRKRAEDILLACAERHTMPIAELSRDDLEELERRFDVKPSEVHPRVFLRITDNWVELSLRFIVRDHGVRDVKDAMSREILDQFEEAGIGIASATFEIVGLPDIHLVNNGRR